MCDNYSAKFLFSLISISCVIYITKADIRTGPDPWDLDGEGLSNKIKNDPDVPPDLRIYPKKKPEPESSLGSGEWFFRRIMSIMLKGGQAKKNEDDSIEVSLQMRFEPEQWATLEEYLRTSTSFTDDMYRRSVGSIEAAIYQPTITDKIVMAWSEYIQIYLMEYKTLITWTLAICGISGAFIWLWSRMSHRHFIMIIFLALYLYEVFVSYKEAENQEIDRFVAAMNSCSWSFWSSKCEMPKPDVLIFLKHMNPLKIGIRMFTSLVSEPLIILSDTLKIMVHGITDGMWYPFDKIVYGILIITFNILLLFLLIMIIFNFIFNIPFNLSYLGISLGVTQRNRTLFAASKNESSVGDNDNANTDRISGATLNKLLDVFARALPAVQNINNNNTRQVQNVNNGQQQLGSNKNFEIRRSASTGRLSELSSSSLNNKIDLRDVPRRRNVPLICRSPDGSGDAH